MAINRFLNIFGAYALAATLFFGATALEGRFFVEDADEIDREELLSTEYYNDAQSYTFFDGWLEAYDASQVALLISAGSLNKTRFLYEDYFKFGAAPTPGPFLNFHHKTFHDELIQARENVIELGYGNESNFSLSILGEGDSQKKWADLGLRFKVQDRDQLTSLTVTYWSVDHYYRSKEDIKSDTYARPIFSYDVQASVRVPETEIKFTLKSLFDSPLLWQRVSKNYFYTATRTQNDLNFSYPIDNKILSLSVYDENKKEAKTWLQSPANTEMEKSLSRRVQKYTLRYVHKIFPTQIFTGEIGNILRTANYEYSVSNWQEDTLYGIEPFSSDSRREEPFLSGFYYFPIPGKEQHGMQIGLINNLVHIADDTGNHQKLESKFKTAFDVKITPQSRAGVNITWDIDQLAHDFPYSKKPFKPWGGGNLNLAMIF